MLDLAFWLVHLDNGSYKHGDENDDKRQKAHLTMSSVVGFTLRISEQLKNTKVHYLEQ